MASRSAGAQISVLGLGKVMRALRAVDKEAPRQLRAEFRQELEPIRLQAASRVPVGAGPTPGGGDNRRPHIAATLRGAARGNRLVLVNRHPGANVLNWGGTIRPRGVPITFSSGREAVFRTVKENTRDLQAGIRRRIERVGAANGL